MTFLPTRSKRAGWTFAAATVALLATAPLTAQGDEAGESRMQNRAIPLVAVSAAPGSTTAQGNGEAAPTPVPLQTIRQALEAETPRTRPNIRERAGEDEESSGSASRSDGDESRLGGDQGDLAALPADRRSNESIASASHGAFSCNRSCTFVDFGEAEARAHANYAPEHGGGNLRRGFQWLGAFLEGRR